MKLINILLSLSILFAFLACSDDDEPVMPHYEPTVVTLSTTDTLFLTQATAGQTAFSLSWVPYKQEQLAVGNPTYLLQMDLPENNFRRAQTLISTSGTFGEVTIKDLNTMVAGYFMQSPDEPVDFNFRVITQYGLGNGVIESSASETFTFTIVPYEANEIRLYIPGLHNGWDFGDYIINIEGSSSEFAGYIYLNGGFKFTTQDNWDDGTNYGDGGEGILNTAGDAGNLTVPEEGLYYLTVNTEELTWTYQYVSWGIVGDATPGGWDNDTPLEYNSTDKVLTATVDLTTGAFKFRRDGNWDINLGLGESNDNTLAASGSDIPVSTPGNYRISLNIFNTSVYTYSLERP